MDILYISPETSKALTKYCEESLIEEVKGHFATVGKIIEEQKGEHQGRWWIITDYIKNRTIDNRKKLSVILSMAAICGFIQIDDRIEMGDSNVLCMLKELNYISDEDLEYFLNALFMFRCNKGKRFS